jgi:hypothetical protein
MLIVDLDTTPTSTEYTLKACGYFINTAVPSWPADVYLMQLNSEPFSRISSVSQITFNTSDICYEAKVRVSIQDGTQMRQDMKNYASLVLDLSPILKMEGASANWFTVDSAIQITKL